MPNAHELTVAIASVIQCQIVQVCALLERPMLWLPIEYYTCSALSVRIGPGSGSSSSSKPRLMPALAAHMTNTDCWRFSRAVHRIVLLGLTR